jgi:hypothetical protein
MKQKWSRADQARVRRIIGLMVKAAGSGDALGQMVGGLTRQAIHKFANAGRVPAHRCPAFAAAAAQLGVKSTGDAPVTIGTLNPDARIIEESTK